VFNFAASKLRTLIMTKITVAKGDGIGPEIMDATLDILKAAGAKRIPYTIGLFCILYLCEM
jgi:isocitrate dehydrogenase